MRWPVLGSRSAQHDMSYSRRGKSPIVIGRPSELAALVDDFRLKDILLRGIAVLWRVPGQEPRLQYFAV